MKIKWRAKPKAEENPWMTVEEALERSKRMHPKKAEYKPRTWTKEEIKASRYRL